MKNSNSLSAVLATAFLATAALSGPVHSAEFGIQPLASGYQLAENTGEKPAEGKCGAKDGKSEEGKCGAAKDGKAHEGKCGAEHKDDAAAESKKPEGKAKEGKCGEAKCGANKKK